MHASPVATCHCHLAHVSVQHACTPAPQVGIIGPDKKFKILTSAEVQDYLQEVE